MAKVTNTFIKSKLNKDLDARLVPNGEYRDAVNVQVSRSEGDSVGSLENVLGNIEIKDFGNSDLTCIGYFANEATGMIYVFLTDYTDPTPNTQRSYSTTAENYIYSYNITNDTSVLLVQGAFLNFSKTNPIFGINLLEDLLFWTDNRNQPRKININLANPSALASPTYYTNEDQISIVKYNPYKAMDMYQEVGTNTGVVETTMKDVTSLTNPNGGTALANGAQTSATINIDSLSGDIIKANENYGALGVKVSLRSLASPYTLTDTGETVSNYTLAGGVITQVILTGSITVADNQMLVFSPNEYYDGNFEGDSEYLSDLFVRFSYRFKFEDSEYSIMAPFTQIAFVPKQDGYFMYTRKEGFETKEDQTESYRSTIVSFVENKIDEIKLVIPRPDTSTPGATLQEAFKISEVDILYKESDGLAVKVVETIPVSDLIINSYGDIEYDYKSTQPFNTLPSDELTRVYDKAPVRAFAQEISGNRVIYANYQNKHTPPESIDYTISASDKSNLSLGSGSGSLAGGPLSGTGPFTLTGATGTIQVGSFISGTGITKGTVVTAVSGSPVNSISVSPAVSGAGGVVTFRPASGEKTYVSKVEYPNSSLKQNRNYEVGVVLSDRYGRQSSVILNKPTQSSSIFSPYFDNSLVQKEWPGDSIKMLFNSPIGPASADQTNDWPGIYNGDPSSSLYNPLGWYSYKIVVKQTEQEYYNVYLPGIMAAYPERHTLELGNTSHTVLINDNINKIPRDLAEVGPDQKQFRSSIRIYGRVENSSNVITYSSPIPTNIGVSNNQYYPGNQADTSTMISTMSDMFEYDPLKPVKPNYFPQFYDYDSNPLIARISTQSQIGQIATTNYDTASASVAANVSNAASISLTGISGSAIVANMVVTGPGIPINTYVISFTGGNNPSVTISQDVELQKFDELVFVQGFPSPDQGTVIRPGLEYLAVYETEPVDSQIDIYWETSTSGLISSLNEAILQGTSGAASFSTFNTSGWLESLTSGGDILAAGFTLQDILGNNITLGGGDAFTLTNVINGYGQNVQLTANGGPYFEMYLDTGLYKIRTTSNYFNNIYYNTDSNLREFTFNFKAVISGTTTSFVEFAFPKNVAPSITSSVPAAGDVFTNSTESTFVVLKGVNGSANTALRTGSLTYTITKQEDSNQNAVNFFGIGGLSVVGTEYQMNLTNLSNSANPIPMGDYTVDVTLNDPGSAVTNVYTLKFGTVPGAVKTGSIDRTGTEPNLNGVLFQVNETNNPNNGWYILSGFNFSELVSNSVGSITQPILIDRKNAITSGSGSCNLSPTFYFAATEQAVKNLWSAYCTGVASFQDVSNFTDFYYQVLEV